MTLRVFHRIAESDKAAFDPSLTLGALQGCQVPSRLARRTLGQVAKMSAWLIRAVQFVGSRPLLGQAVRVRALFEQDA